MKVNVAPKMRRIFRLIKWDMDQAPEQAVPEPEKDPRCAEIIEWELNGPLKKIYKRE